MLNFFVNNTLNVHTRQHSISNEESHFFFLKRNSLFVRCAAILPLLLIAAVIVRYCYNCFLLADWAGWLALLRLHAINTNRLNDLLIIIHLKIIQCVSSIGLSHSMFFSHFFFSAYAKCVCLCVRVFVRKKLQTLFQLTHFSNSSNY